MSERPLHYLSLREVSSRLRRGESTSVEVTRAMLDRIAALDGDLRAYSVVMADAALEAAEAADRDTAAGKSRGPLHGAPVAVKDLCRTKGVRTRAGMPLLDDHVPDYDSTAVVRLREAGAVLLGKLELTEGAFASHHPDVDAPVNPWSPDLWPGASSSGSGVATAAGLCYGSLGSDTGGSIRFPSLACAVTGLKPTWGRVSRHGVFMLSDTLDHLGPMARTAEDCAALLGVLAGRDDLDHHTSLEPVPDYLAELEKGVAGLRIGWDEGHCTHDVDPEAAAGVRAALRELERAGAEVVEISIPDTRGIIEHWAVICAVETAAAHADTYPSQAGRYGRELKSHIEFGRAATSLDVGRANACRNHWRGTMARLFERVDMFIAPPYPDLTPTVEGFTAVMDAPDGLHHLTRYTAPHDMSGSPTLSLPCGFGSGGRPLGFQLVGRDFGEDLLLRAGHAYQQRTDGGRRHPDP